MNACKNAPLSNVPNITQKHLWQIPSLSVSCLLYTFQQMQQESPAFCRHNCLSLLYSEEIHPAQFKGKTPYGKRFWPRNLRLQENIWKMSELNCSLASLTLQLFLNLGRDNFFLLLPLSPSTLITLRHSIREDYVDSQPCLPISLHISCL